MGWGVRLVRGGVKFYRGAPGAARNYVEADRSLADDYYLGEGVGYARRYAAAADGPVVELGMLAGDAYQAWVGGVDPDTGELRGRVRTDGRAVRFCEVVVNGPKSWSLAAELYPEVAAAYAGAQDRAAEAIVGWLAGHATVRVGPRGGQVAIAVEGIEAVTVAHHTSRAGDPHRHLHLQVNARVRAAGGWRGIDTVAVRDSIGAVQGVGHASMVADAGFRAALAGRGLMLDGAGEIMQLARLVGPFSRRAEQIGRQVAGYEADWRAAHPGQTPGPGLRRGWDGRAWAEHRPSKGPAEPAELARGRWVGELRRLGFRDPQLPVPIGALAVGRVDREAAAGEVLARLAAVRSAFNPADVRGQAELLIARAGVVAEAAVRGGLAEDITGRVMGRAVPLLGREGVPGHVRAWTSPAAVAVEADLTGRFAVRAATFGADAAAVRVDAAAAEVGAGLDPAQAGAVAALAGGHALVVVTGAAGAGKTTTLRVVNAALNADGHRLVVVTPTLKAARTARRETGAQAGSAAWLAYQHGWRWDEAGRWTRLHAGQVEPGTGLVYAGPGGEARLAAGDLLVVDEAGMVDQDTARALLVVADEARARVALVGDRHQLAAVGRGGVLDLAGRWAEREVTLEVIHRFTRTVEVAPGILGTVRDDDYAELTLQMRTGQQPGQVFDRLVGRGQVHTHPDTDSLREAVAEQAVRERLAGRSAAVAVGTVEEARELSAAVRRRLVDLGQVDDSNTVSTRNGEDIGVGDRVATRRNDRGSGVANRDTWTVTGLTPDGSLAVSGPGGPRRLPAAYVAEHVELAYASTVHGVQGDTVDVGHLVLGEHTGAAAAYVGMTRGRRANTVHVIADSPAEARRQWVEVAGRERADLGIAAARQAAQQAAAGYTTAPPPAEVDRQLALLLDRLRAAWTEQAHAAEQLTRLGPRVEDAQADAAGGQQSRQALAELRQQMHRQQQTAEQAGRQADDSQQQLAGQAEQHAAGLRRRWAAEQPAAAQAARLVQAGPGRLGWHRGRYQAAQAELQQWKARWQPIYPHLAHPAVAIHLAGQPTVDGPSGSSSIGQAIDRYARTQAGYALPEHVDRIGAAEQAQQAARTAAAAYQQAQHEQTIREAAHGWDTAADLPRLLEQTAAAHTRHTHATSRIDRLTRHPTLTGRADAAAILDHAHTSWASEQRQAQQAAAARQAEHAAAQPSRSRRHENPYRPPGPHRQGPSLGR